jgi:hypothetical protein
MNMQNVNQLPALDLEPGLQSSCTDSDITSVGGVIVGIFTGIVIGVSQE